MRMMEWSVTIGGIAAMIWINWYFFLAQRPPARAPIGSQGVQEIAIAVELFGRGGDSGVRNPQIPPTLPEHDD